jgi:general nucleoside transport system ATP-binding protein
MMERTSDGGGTASTAPPPAVQLTGITKRFGAVMACDHVDLALARGQIHGILGENGAGKSTLMKIMIGLVLPDAGSIAVDGEPCHIPDPSEAARRGIAMVHQHFSLVEPLTVWENVMLGDTGRLDPRAARRRVKEISERYGLDVQPDVRVADLSAGMRQRVEIVKCLRRNPSILAFDEPTSVLTPSESEQLFSVLRRVVNEEGWAVALVSHKLDEVLRATDVITIMRDGRVVERIATRDADAHGLARAMVGREVSLRSESAALGAIRVAAESARDIDAAPVSPPADDRAVVLRITDARLRGSDGRATLDGLSIEVRAGEIVGVAGVEGNGQRELGDLLSSLAHLDGGTVEVAGRMVDTRRPGAMTAAGVGAVPEDRHDSGCVLDLSVAENLIMVKPERLARGGVLDRRAVRRQAEALIARFGIQAASPDAPVWSLSGGNQQRLVLARELSLAPAVLVAAQPTRGLDVGAIEYMNERLVQVAESGTGVLLISTDLEEILALAHRVVVLYRGRVVGEMRRDEVDLQRLGLLMGGVAA